MKTTTRTNREITAREVRLIDETGGQLGIVSTAVALERAASKSLDLVEVAADAVPPVCRIMDFTKYIFEQKRKIKSAKKKTTHVETKEIKLRPNIDPHDLGIKIRHIREFLEKGHKVKLTLRYRQREMRHYEIGTQLMDRLVEDLSSLAIVESEGRGSGAQRMLSILISPKKAPIVKETSKPQSPQSKETLKSDTKIDAKEEDAVNDSFPTSKVEDDSTE